MAQPDSVPSDLGVARLSVEQYHAMIDTGILRSGDPVELLEGILVTKMTKNPPHVTACKLVASELTRLLPRGFHVQTRDPITTHDSEPEPDVAVVRGNARDYTNAHPTPADVPLVVEVADNSLRRDRGTKRRIYARAGIAQYWIVNVEARAIEVHRTPSGDEYAAHEVVPADGSVELTLDGAVAGAVSVAAVLP